MRIYDFDDNYLPVFDDLETEDVVGLALREKTQDDVAQKLDILKNQLGSMIVHNPEAVITINAIRAEYEELIHLRVALLTPKALDTLEEIMNGIGDPKAMIARQKSAETIMDRGLLPKVVKNANQVNVQDTTSILPSLDDLMKKASSPTEAMDMVRRHRKLMDDIEALRAGAREIIDGEFQPQDQTETTNTNSGE